MEVRRGPLLSSVDVGAAIFIFVGCTRKGAMLRDAADRAREGGAADEVESESATSASQS
jgi:hypothetical protein